MCTVTWLQPAGGWELFANRDETRARRPARPPRVVVREGVRIVAPVDADAEGTWIGANEHGLGLCLLNGRSRRADEGPAGFRSRGLLVRELLSASTLEEVAGRLADQDLDRYRGLFLLAIAVDRPPALHAWSGTELTRTVDPPQPLVSSSRDTDEARRHRARAWRRFHPEDAIPTPESLAAFHRSHLPEPGPWSVCMHREDARSVSASRVLVRPTGRVEFHYAPGPPCRTGWNAAVGFDGPTVRRA